MNDLAALLGLTYTTLVVALGAAILGLAAGGLGSFAVLRGRSLVGDALAHAALPGVAIAFMLTDVRNPTTLLIGAAVAGLVGALVIVGAERLPRVTSDTATGVVLAGFFSLGIVLLTHIAHTAGANQAGLDKYLFGQAAGIVVADLWAMGAVSVAAGLVALVFFRPLKATLFDQRFAAGAGLSIRAVEVFVTALLVAAIVVGIRTVGTILMVSLLVAPTVAARQFATRLAILVPMAAIVGAAIGVAGALAATAIDAPTGPVIALVAFAVAVFSVVAAPRRGLLAQALRRRRQRRAAAAGAAGSLARCQRASAAVAPRTSTAPPPFPRPAAGSKLERVQ